MYYANDETGMRIDIDRAEKRRHYFCPVCGSPVLIKRGKIIAHHFAHEKGKQCDIWYSSKMSPWHRKMQDKFPTNTREIKVWNKGKTEFHVADVLVTCNEKRYVFEFQHSGISSDEFIARTCFYMNLGYRVVWIFDFQDSKSPKCIFYEEDSKDKFVKNVVWPGRDRVKLFDSFYIRQFLDEVQCNCGEEVQILFFVNTGLGRKRLRKYGNGFQSYKWEFVNPFERQPYFIKPLFSDSCGLANFYAEFYTEEAIDKQIRILCKCPDIC